MSHRTISEILTDLDYTVAIYIKHKKYSSAIQLLQQLEKDLPNCTDVQAAYISYKEIDLLRRIKLSLAFCFKQTNQSAEAMICQLAVAVLPERNGKKSASAETQAEALFRAKKYEDAIAKLDTAIQHAMISRYTSSAKEKKRAAKLHVCKSQCYLNCGLLPLATESALEALRYDPTDLDAEIVLEKTSIKWKKCDPTSLYWTAANQFFKLFSNVGDEMLSLLSSRERIHVSCPC